MQFLVFTFLLLLSLTNKSKKLKSKSNFYKTVKHSSVGSNKKLKRNRALMAGNQKRESQKYEWTIKRAVSDLNEMKKREDLWQALDGGNFTALWPRFRSQVEFWLYSRVDTIWAYLNLAVIKFLLFCSQFIFTRRVTIKKSIEFTTS